MKLYVINATPWRDDVQRSANIVNMIDYPSDVAMILAEHSIEGFTMYEVQGYWQGKAERSFKIEIALEDTRILRAITGTVSVEVLINRICTILRDKYNQESVMLTLPNGEVEFI